MTPCSVLNLFSRDTYVVDQVLPRLLGMTFRTFATCLAILVVIGVSFPPFLIAVIPLGTCPPDFARVACQIVYSLQAGSTPGS